MVNSRMSVFGGTYLWLMLITFLVLQVSTVIAGDTKQIKWREAFITVEANLQEVEGHEGHAVGVMQQRGFAFYDDGQVATVNVWLTFKRSAGGTSYRGYAVYSFPDGASKVGRFTGSGDPRGEQSGQFTLESGSGRYEGITGQGSFSGRGFPPHGDIYLDVSGAYSLQ